MSVKSILKRLARGQPQSCVATTTQGNIIKGLDGNYDM